MFGFLWSQAENVCYCNTMCLFQTTIYKCAVCTRWSLGSWLWSYFLNLHKPILEFCSFDSNWISEKGLQMRFHSKRENKTKQNLILIHHVRTRAIVSWQLGKFFVFLFVWKPNRSVSLERENKNSFMKKKTWANTKQ